jgi:hypothetical protein
MEPTWQITITTKPLNFTKMQQSPTGPPLNSELSRNLGDDGVR